MKRRDFIKDSAVSGLAIATSSPSFDDVLGRTKPSSSSALSGSETAFWPDGARLVISISMQMEAGAQPLSGAESPMPKLDPLYPDLPTAKWYEYGFKRRASATVGHVRPPKSQSYVPHGRRNGRSSPGPSQRDRAAWARSVRPRTNVGCAIFHDT